MAVPLAAADAPPLQLGFSLPAQLSNEIQGDRLDWALLVFEPQQVHGSLMFGPESSRIEVLENALTYERHLDGGRGTVDVPSTTSEPSAVSGATPLGAATMSSVFVKAANLTLRFQDAQVAIEDAERIPSLSVLASGGLDRDRPARFEKLATEGRVLLAGQGMLLQGLSADGDIYLEEHGLDLACQNCPTGPDREEQQIDESGIRVTKRTLRFHQFTVSDGMLQLEGRLRVAAFGGSAPTLDISGTARLPQVSGLACQECPSGEDQSLTLAGSFRFEGLTVADGPRASTALSGNVQGARLDEVGISPEALVLPRVAVAAAATIGLVAVIKFLAVPLFTRLSKAEALEHPKRQVIFAYIQEHPGANFREVARQTGIASGTVRHHLTVLERAGHVVERPHQGTVRLFENHGKFDHNWSDLVLLREPPLAWLHGWLLEHPSSPQKDILEAFELQGWSRSTTQHRLARLVEGGVVTMRLQGRLKIYAVAERPVVKSASFGLGSLVGASHLNGSPQPARQA